MVPFREDLPVRDEAHRYMQLPAHERHKLSCDECAEACLVLSQWAAHLDRIRQREESNANLLYHRIEELVGDKAHSAKGFKYEEKLATAVRADDEAWEVYLDYVQARARSDRLNFHAKRIEGVAEAYKSLSNVRRRDRQHGD